MVAIQNFPNDVSIGVVGCAGRMGRALVAQILRTPGCTLGGGSERIGHEMIGLDIALLAHEAPIGLPILDDPEELFAKVDAVIDFTSPRATAEHAALAGRYRKTHVIGTTGLGAHEERAILEASEKTAVIHSANMSVGVNLLLALTRHLSEVLDSGFDIEILEMHHRNKIDAPSGTALALGRAAAEGRGLDFEQVKKAARNGITGPRNSSDIGFAVLRGGNVVCEHTVIFAAENERIEISHKAGDRAIFAEGAVKAAVWGRGRSPGLYNMQDVLGIKQLN